MRGVTIQHVTQGSGNRDNLQLLITVPGIELAKSRTSSAEILADLGAALKLVFGDDAVMVIE